MPDNLIDKLICPSCGSSLVRGFGGLSARAGDSSAVDITCEACDHRLSLDDGILTAYPDREMDCGVWDGVYEIVDLTRSLGIKLIEKGLENPRLLESSYPVARLVKRLDRPVECSVELGAGTGAYSLVLKKLGLVEHVTLVDYSREALVVAARLYRYFGESCDLVHSRIEEVPLADKAFDLTLSAGLVEHYATREERGACIGHHLRLADLAYVQAPYDTAAYWLQRSIVSALKAGWPFGFERPMRSREMEMLASSIGASVIARDYHYSLSILAFFAPAFLTSRMRVPGWLLAPLRTDVGCMIAVRP